jgi:hypothetical protein
MTRLTHIFYLLMLVSFWGCNYFPESRFELAPDSRLPNWFTLPENLSRADVTVRMSYYIEPCGIFGKKNSLGCATFELWDIRKYMHGKNRRSSRSQTVFDTLDFWTRTVKIRP